MKSKCKNSFLKQWFIIKYLDDSGVEESTDLLFNCMNNHYIQGWMEKYGYDSFKNVLNIEDVEAFVQALNESTERVPDDFDNHFPDEYIEEYSLWNTSENEYWESITEYKKHVKKEMCELVMNLEEVIDTKGTFEYHIFFNHF